MYVSYQVKHIEGIEQVYIRWLILESPDKHIRALEHTVLYSKLLALLFLVVPRLSPKSNPMNYSSYAGVLIEPCPKAGKGYMFF